MDFNIESPFSFDLGDELFPLPTLSSTDIPVPLLPSISPLKNNNTVSQKPKNARRRKPPPPPTSDDIVDESPNKHKKKKIMHRDVERQRRQEMSTLRSLLPLEYLKGKRSICDHMLEAVKYIRYMQNKIQQLSDKRDELKKLSDKNPVVGTVETLNSSTRDSVVVRPTNGSRGVRVLLDTATQHRLPVSNILQALAAEGLEIITCISSKQNNRFIHTIESQVVDNSGSCRSIDVSELQHKLTNLEYFPLD